MGRQHGWAVGLGVVLVAACVALAQAPRPAPVPKPPAPQQKQKAQPAPPGQPEVQPAAEPALVMAASVASTDEVSAFAREFGLAGLPFLSPQFIEEQMPFIGPGGLATDRPVGVLFYGGRGVKLEDAATFVLPVNAGKAQLQGFVENGAQPAEGREDMVTLEGVGFRRGQDQFVFGAVPAAVAAVPEDVLTAAYAGQDGLLARIDFDVAAAKRALPEQYEAFFAELDKEVDTEDPAERAGANLVTEPLRALTRLAVSLARSDAGGLRLGIVAEPFTLPDAAGGKFARPGFPKGTLFRADLAYPPAKALSRLADLAKLLEQDEDFRTATNEQREQLRAMWVDVTKLLLGGEAGSLGVRLVEGEPVVYWVTRHAAGAAGAGAADPGRDMQAIAARAQGLTKLGGGGRESAPVATHENYSVGEGLKAHRLTLFDEGKPDLYIDAIGRDGAMLMAISATDGKHLGELLPLKPEGDASALLSGWLDLGALAAADLLPSGEDLGVGETAMKDVKAAMQGRRLDWTVSPQRGAVRIDVDVPRSLLQSLPKVLGLVQER